MNDLGVKLHTVELLLLVLNDCKGAVFGAACMLEAFGKRTHRIAMAHPEP
ncbi:hypothetical protein SDC9_45457 [bioreactor metagenome]|uniref:Uncharacterized protein n=1 Tax=bioreactor metagenome TaxID=1076179 RepID=A0A644W6Y9_9ZZZZ